MSFITSAEKLAKSGFKITDKEIALARRLDDATADILKGSEKILPSTRKTLLESYQAFINAAPEGTGKFQAARQYMNAARQAFPEGEAGQAAFNKFKTTMSEEVRRAEGLDAKVKGPTPEAPKTEAPKAEAPKPSAADLAKREEIQAKQRSIVMEIENAKEQKVTALQTVGDFLKARFSKNGVLQSSHPPQPAIRLSDALEKLRIHTESADYRSLPLAEGRLSARETLNRLHDGYRVEPHNMRNLHSALANGTVNNTAFSTMAKVGKYSALAGGILLGGASWFDDRDDQLGVPGKIEYHVKKSWMTWGGEGGEEFKTEIEASTRTDAVTTALKRVAADITQESQKAEKGKNEESNKNLVASNELAETKMFIDLGKESAHNLQKEQMQERAKSRLPLSQAFENATQFYDAITQDDEYGLKGKKPDLDAAFKAAATRDSFSLPEFKKHLEKQGLNEKAVQTAVEFTRNSFEP